MIVLSKHHKDIILNLIQNASNIEELGNFGILINDIISIFGSEFVFVARTKRISKNDSYSFSNIYYVKNKNGIVEKYKENNLLNFDPVFFESQKNNKPIVNNFELTVPTTNENSKIFFNVFEQSSIREVISYHYKQNNRMGTYFVAELNSHYHHNQYYCEIVNIITPHISSALQRVYRNNKKRIIKPLTKKEVIVLELLASGYTIAEIGSKMYVTERTIRFHINNIIHKLNVKNKLQAVLVANYLEII